MYREEDKTMASFERTVNDNLTYIETMYKHYYKTLWSKEVTSYLKLVEADRTFTINNISAYSDIRNQTHSIEDASK